ncbi:hypothetical protein AAMO2058_000600500 [Amorphochlora amoebiformis]
MSRGNRDQTTFFTPEMDEMLRTAVKSSSRRVKWDVVAKMLPGVTPKACRSRWEDIQAYSGLENMGFAARQPLRRWVGGSGVVRSSLSNLPSETRSRASRQKAEHLTAGGAEGRVGQEMIVIHVCDEARNLKRDFSCSRQLLTNGMKYFRSYLTDESSTEDIDISVHCDVHVFQWLMNYINSPKDPPKLDLRNVMSILISSDFLQMNGLVHSCLAYMKKNIKDILRTPIDLNCLNNKLLTKLSDLFNAEELDDIKDDQDKLTSKLYMRKLEKLLHDSQNQMYRCVHCGEIFTPVQQRKMRCSSFQNTFIDFHGNAIPRHSPSKSWDVRKHLLRLRGNHRLKWRSIYWRISARIYMMTCEVCGEVFSAADMNNCKYHPKKPIFMFGQNTGIYPCCNSKAMRFSIHPKISSEGCTSRPHTPEASYMDSARARAILKFVSDKSEKNIPIVSSEDGPLQLRPLESLRDQYSRLSIRQVLIPLSLPAAPDTWNPALHTGNHASGTGAEEEEDSERESPPPPRSRPPPRHVSRARRGVRKYGATQSRVSAARRTRNTPTSSTLPGVTDGGVTNTRNRNKSPPLRSASRPAIRIGSRNIRADDSGMGKSKRQSGASDKGQENEEIKSISKMDQMIDQDRQRMGDLMSTLASLRTSVNMSTSISNSSVHTAPPIRRVGSNSITRRRTGGSIRASTPLRESTSKRSGWR